MGGTGGRVGLSDRCSARPHQSQALGETPKSKVALRFAQSGLGSEWVLASVERLARGLGSPSWTLEGTTVTQVPP